MRAFLDANVLFSASKSGSAFARLLKFAGEHVELLTSELAVAEANRNLAVKRPEWLTAFEELLPQIEVVPTVVFALEVDLAAKDVPLLCAAIRAEADYFVTGDRRDFGHLFDSAVSGVTVVTPLRFGQIITDEEDLS